MNEALCPEDAELERSLSGDLPLAEVEKIAGHLEICGRCADRLRTVESLQAGPPPGPVDANVAPPGLADLMARLRALPGGASPFRGSSARVDGPNADGPNAGGQESDARIRGLLDPARADDELGRLGTCRVRRLVGQGGMGIVLDALDTRTRRRVALKIIRPELESHQDIRERFLHEARAMAAVRHANVVRVFQVEHAGDRSYLVMEYLEGQSLAERLRRGPACSLDEVVQVGYQIAAGLAAAHAQRLIHRDVKPDNVFLARRGEPTATGRDGPVEFQVKLLDFGLAMPVTDEEAPEGRQGAYGTPAFMSPEQARGEPVDERADLYGLGCVLYRMVTGRLPRDVATPTQLVRAARTTSPPSVRTLAPSTPPPLARLIDRLLAERPEQRPASAREVADELALLRPRSVAFRRRTRLTAVAVGFLLCAALPLAIWSAGRWYEPPPAPRPAAAESGPNDGPPTGSPLADNPTVPVQNPADTGPPPLDPQWLERVRLLPPAEQVREVVAELQRRNPGYGGEHRSEHKGEFVDKFWIESTRISDLTPVQVFRELVILYCPGKHDERGILRDLRPLAGMQLRSFDFGYARVDDLSPLRGMPLFAVKAVSSPLTTLEPLEGMALSELQVGYSQVDDISVVKGMPLRILSVPGTLVEDLSPIAGCPTLRWLEIHDSRVRDLSPLRGTPLRKLSCANAPIEDWSVLADLPLEEILLTYDPQIHRDLLLRIPTLKSVNYKPAHWILKTFPPETP